MNILSARIEGVSMYQINLVDMDGNPAGESRCASITIGWSIADHGFGEFILIDRGERRPPLLTAEGLSKEQVKAVLGKLVDDAKPYGGARCEACEKCSGELRIAYYCPQCYPDQKT